MLKNDAERWSADPVSLAGIAFHRGRTRLARARQHQRSIEVAAVSALIAVNWHDAALP